MSCLRICSNQAVVPICLFIESCNPQGTTIIALNII